MTHRLADANSHIAAYVAPYAELVAKMLTKRLIPLQDPNAAHWQQPQQIPPDHQEPV